MFRNLAANLILHERIQTTDAKAKELRSVVEKLITKAKRLGKVGFTPQDKLSDPEKADRLHVQRMLSSYLPRFGVRVEKGGETKQVDLVEKVLVDLAKRFEDRAGGYTRIVKFGPRRGDNAPVSIIEFVGENTGSGGSDDEAKPAKKAKKKAEKAAAAAG
jgi:large subunit ribosomal protein L17